MKDEHECGREMWRRTAKTNDIVTCSCGRRWQYNHSSWNLPLKFWRKSSPARDGGVWWYHSRAKAA
jgi:hypothetical protein